MTDQREPRVLYIIVCGAGPASDVGKLVDLAHAQGWKVQVIATPAALEFVDVAALETQTGQPIRSYYRKPGQPRSLRASAIIVAPATYNTVNKWALGISDTYALGLLAEAPGLNIPIVVLPFVNNALAGRSQFRNSIATLRREGVYVMLGEGLEPHPPGEGDRHIGAFPWRLALDKIEHICKT